MKQNLKKVMSLNTQKARRLPPLTMSPRPITRQVSFSYFHKHSKIRSKIEESESSSETGASDVKSLASSKTKTQNFGLPREKQELRKVLQQNDVFQGLYRIIILMVVVSGLLVQL